jgi:hypothetical protein
MFPLVKVKQGKVLQFFSAGEAGKNEKGVEISKR